MTDYNNDVTAIREAFEEGKGRKLLLSDSVLDLVVDNCKNWDEMDEEETYSFLEKAEQEASNVGIANPQISELASKFDHDDIAQAELTACLDAVKKSKTSAVDLYSQFRRIYTQDEMNSFPRAGWNEEEVEGTNYAADIVKTKTGNGDDITTVWTNDFVSALARGREYETIIAETSKEIKTSGSVPKYKNTGRKVLEDINKTANQMRNALRSMVKRSIELHHQFEAIKGMPQVEIEFVPSQMEHSGIRMTKEFGQETFDKETDFYVTSGPKPIFIMPKGKALEGKLYSVTQVNAMDVSAAIAAGGTMANLVDTMKRGSDDTANGDGDGSKWSEEEAMEGTSMLANFFHKRDNVAMVSKILADKKHPERNDWLENISTLYFAIKPLYLKNQAAIEEATGAKEEKAA